jgi:peptidoglycan/LPS O-acetylase OafA/YrhL
MGERKESSHLAQLDGLRAFAVVAVLLHHTIPVLNNRVNIGGFGVRLFFVLSGFLITGILLRARADAVQEGVPRGSVLRAFYARRFLRIFPLYYFVLFSAALLDLPRVRETFVWQVSYLSNFFSALQPTWPEKPIDHLWSLSIEEQFYLVWPSLVLFLPMRVLPWLFGLTLAVGPISRGLLTWLMPLGMDGGAFTTSCLDSLGIGALLAFWQARRTEAERAQDRPWRLCLVFGLMLLMVVLASRWSGKAWRVRMIFEDTAFLLVSVWLVERAARGFRGIGKAVLEFAPLVYVGTISYGIYVYHEFIPPLIEMIHQHFGMSLGFPAEEGLVRFGYVTAATLLLAALSWHFYEKPLNDLKRYFPYARRSAGGVGIGISFALWSKQRLASPP